MAESKEAAIEVGQVFKEKTRNRYVKVHTLAVKSAWCVPCFQTGAPWPQSGRARYITFEGLRKRFHRA